jgi:hypothetical protein
MAELDFGTLFSAGAKAYAGSGAPGAKELGRGLEVAAGTARGAAIGATIGTLVPGIGTAVGAAAGAIVGAVVELGDWISDLWGTPPRWHKVTDAYGSRQMPIWWSPQWRHPYEHGPVGERLYRHRRAIEDGCSRSETLFALEQLIPSASSAVRKEMREQARASFMGEAWSLVGNGAKDAGQAAKQSGAAALARALVNAPGADPAKVARMRQGLAASAILSVYRRRGLALDQAHAVVREHFPKIQIGAGHVAKSRARAAGARRTYLDGVHVPRLPSDGSSVEDVARAITAMEAYMRGADRWADEADQNPLHVAQMVAWLRGDKDWQNAEPAESARQTPKPKRKSFRGTVTRADKPAASPAAGELEFKLADGRVCRCT